MTKGEDNEISHQHYSNCQLPVANCQLPIAVFVCDSDQIASVYTEGEARELGYYVTSVRL